VSVQPDSLPLGWQDRKAYFRERYFPAEKIYYIQYNKCWSREAEEEFGSGASALFMPSFREFEKLVFQTLRKQEVDKLVFDLRFNNGGSSIQGTRFIERVRKTRFGEHGKVYLIVGRETSSEAIINAVDLMKCFDVVVVGENSGGKPNDFGDVRRFVLPRSNLVVNYPTRYYTLVEGDPQSIIPDIPTPESFATYMAGIDPAFEAIRKHNPE
jgi:C-terminal processing protease CtpA/Prc